MDGAEALASLGLHPGAEWAEIKRSYRTQIRAHHPDLSDEPGGQEAAARIIEAYAVLTVLAGEGRLPAAAAEPKPTPEDTSSAEPEPADTAVLVVSEGELFDRLLDAAHDVGDVTYLDPEAQIVQLLVTLPDWPPSQLTCQLTSRGGDDVIVSTLDSMDNREAPPIESVVELLARQLRAR